jgi:hypothetical protein
LNNDCTLTAEADLVDIGVQLFLPSREYDSVVSLFSTSQREKMSDEGKSSCWLWQAFDLGDIGSVCLPLAKKLALSVCHSERNTPTTRTMNKTTSPTTPSGKGEVNSPKEYQGIIKSVAVSTLLVL